MTNLSESIDRKFIDVIPVEGFEVLSPDGWQPLTSISQTIEYEVFEVRLSNGKSLQCADNHILITANGHEIFAVDSLGTRINTIDGIATVINVESLGYSENMFDLQVDSESHTYYTNGIASHNSSITIGYALWKANFHSNEYIVILAHKHSTSKEMFSRFRYSYQELPMWLKQGVSEWNKQSCMLANNTTVLASATSGEAITGLTVTTLIIDECAKVNPNLWQEFFNSSYPTLASNPNAMLIILSTPKGKNHFYKMYMDAVNGRSSFKPHKINWYDVPGRDEKFKKEQISILGQRGWEQEFESEFLGSDNTLISSGTLSGLAALTPIRKMSDDKLLIYEEPKKDRIYVAFCDVGEGLGQDYSTIQILDVTEIPYKQVAVYRDNEIKTNLFNLVIDKIGRSYNDALVVIENNIGQETANLLNEESDYPNQFYWDKKFGLRTTTRSKNVGNSQLKDMLENGKLEIIDESTINELEIYKKVGATYKAAAGEGNYDDLVIPLVLFAYFMNVPAYVENWLDAEDIKQKQHKTTIERIEEELPLFGFFDDGIETVSFVNNES